MVYQVVIFFQIFANSQRQLDAALHIEVLPIREIAAVPNAEAPLRIVEIQQRNAAFLRHLPQRTDIHMLIFVIRAWIRNQDDLNALRFAEIADALEIFSLAPVNFLARLRPEERWLRMMLHLVAFDEALPVYTASARPAGKREILRRQRLPVLMHLRIAQQEVQRLLTACGKTNAGSGSSGSMSGSSGTSSAQTQTAAWKTGLGVVTEATDQDRAGKIELAAAAVLLDGEGKLESVLLDELEVSVSADSTGHVTLPTDWRTKRQKGDDYPLAEVSSLKKGWAEQADAFANYLIGMTPEQVSMLKVDKDGKPTDADLLSGCTIAVDRYRDAVTRACANARALGAAKGDRAALGIEAVNGTSDITATDDKDVNAQVDVSIVALTTDADHRVTSAIADMAEPALTVVSDGGVTAPDLVKTKLELGEDYGMRGASALGKEWYEHSEGFCDALKGKTRTEIAGLSGGDADLKALCTIDITDLQKAALDALS